MLRNLAPSTSTNEKYRKRKLQVTGMNARIKTQFFLYIKLKFFRDIFHVNKIYFYIQSAGDYLDYWKYLFLSKYWAEPNHTAKKRFSVNLFAIIGLLVTHKF